MNIAESYFFQLSKLQSPQSPIKLDIYLSSKSHEMLQYKEKYLLDNWA